MTPDTQINVKVSCDANRADGVQYMIEAPPGTFNIVTLSLDINSNIPDAPEGFYDHIRHQVIQQLKDAGMLYEFPKNAS
ncbi:hypothetical protein [Paraburkholderia terrae]|uniref:hypothetical protein n=1 Tax=Paraburkholderia terrae TaxID=311230 RepID=UPI002050910F|nr:hypothetical protein [Paraburkholderia terrae]BDC37928.1 hypothetical protein PTKU15_12250 [Paraburkholderia terrae]